MPIVLDPPHNDSTSDQKMALLINELLISINPVKYQQVIG
jgi:hypothetical protein